MVHLNLMYTNACTTVHSSCMTDSNSYRGFVKEC